MPFATPTWDKDLACVVINLSSKVVATTRTQFPGDEDYYLAIPTLTKIFIRSFHQEFPRSARNSLYRVTDQSARSAGMHWSSSSFDLIFKSATYFAGSPADIPRFVCLLMIT